MIAPRLADAIEDSRKRGQQSLARGYISRVLVERHRLRDEKVLVLSGPGILFACS